MLPPRYWVYAGCVVGALLSAGAVLAGSGEGWGALFLFGILTALGTQDLLQTHRSVRRNYPLTARVRYLAESVRTEIRQYFLEDDNEATPFSRVQRSIVYQRAKNIIDKRPFGTQLDVYAASYEWINHSLAPVRIPNHDFRVSIGGSQCTKPYVASVFNISAMSFGALSANAIRALNAGAKRGNFYHDTGEGSISPYHLESGGDLVWEIGTSYFGCRDAHGQFCSEKFAENAALDSVRMIEIKLSQGAKPGHGGVLPAAKVTREIARTRGIPESVECISPAQHSAFSKPQELLDFVTRLRELSGGKPVGFKLAIGHPWEWFAIAKAMHLSGQLPDFIVVDGGEGGTGAAPLEFSNHVGTPLSEGLMLVHNTLQGLGLRNQIRIGAAGKIISAFDLARTMAIGADWCNAARGFMFALGCIQSQSCHTGKCPTGVATQDPSRQRGLVVPDKASRVFQFHQNTLKAMRELLGAAGLSHPEQLCPEHVIRRVSSTKVRSLATLHRFLAEGELLHGVPDHPLFERYWVQATPESFTPVPGRDEFTVLSSG